MLFLQYKLQLLTLTVDYNYRKNENRNTKSFRSIGECCRKNNFKN